jgi:hypothetical protein
LGYFEWRSHWSEEQKAAYSDLFYRWPVGSTEDPFEPNSVGSFFIHASGAPPFTYLGKNFKDFDTLDMADVIPMGYKALFILERLFLVSPGGQIAASWISNPEVPTTKWTAQGDPWLFKVFRPPDPFLELRRCNSDRRIFADHQVRKAMYIANEFETLSEALTWTKKKTAWDNWPRAGTPLLVTRLIRWQSWH